MKRSDPLYQRIVATWRALGRRAEAEARQSQATTEPESDLEVDLDSTDAAADDDLFAWTEGGLLLFTLLRILLRNEDATSIDALGDEIHQALTELVERAGVNGYASVVAGAGDLAADEELVFLAAFNEHLMMRHQERVRILDSERIDVAKLGLAETLTASLTANIAAGVDVGDEPIDPARS